MLEYKYVYATLILRGKGLNPQDVTKSLDLCPSTSFKKGDWRNTEDKWKDNFWSLSSQGKVQSNNLVPHLEWLINQFEPVKSKLLAILDQENIVAEISCFWILPTTHENLILSADLISKINDLHLSLSMEIYSP